MEPLKRRASPQSEGSCVILRLQVSARPYVPLLSSWSCESLSTQNQVCRATHVEEAPTRQNRRTSTPEPSKQGNTRKRGSDTPRRTTQEKRKRIEWRGKTLPGLYSSEMARRCLIVDILRRSSRDLLLCCGLAQIWGSCSLGVRQGTQMRRVPGSRFLQIFSLPQRGCTDIPFWDILKMTCRLTTGTQRDDSKKL